MRARSALAVVPPALPVPQQELAGMVKVLTCGSVDDGKSTLIGRLLWDASDLFDDQREALRSGRRVLNGEHLDYSLLVDGLIVGGLESPQQIIVKLVLAGTGTGVHEPGEISDHEMATTMLPTAYSIIRAQPIIQAASSPNDA